MPVHNGMPYVREAIASILTQTEPDLELLIIDDGSTDATPDELAALDDPRVRVLAASGHGLVSALGDGLAAARSAVIARMDADDVSAPERLARQLAVLDAVPDLVAVGASFDVVTADGSRRRLEPALPDDDDLRRELYVRNPFGHATVTMRRHAVMAVGGYRATSPGAEDFDLWIRLADHGRLAAIAEPLLQWRSHADGVSSKHRRLQHASTTALLDARWAVPPGARTTHELRSRLRRVGAIAGPAHVDRLLQVELAIAAAAWRRGHRALARRQVVAVVGLGARGVLAAMLYLVTAGRFTTGARVARAVRDRRRRS